MALPNRIVSTRLMSAATETSTDPSPIPPQKKIPPDRVISGVQPTGTLHLGNYLGAIRQWVDFQDQEQRDEEGNVVPTENYFFIVDLHAITMPHVPEDLTESTLKSAALYVACGE
jgi:tryptophanyl-tRNA synthetase